MSDFQRKSGPPASRPPRTSGPSRGPAPSRGGQENGPKNFAPKKKRRRVRSKQCACCMAPCTTLVRCRWDRSKGWTFVCDICWPSVADRRGYQYGGTWCNGRIVDSEWEKIQASEERYRAQFERIAQNQRIQYLEEGFDLHPRKKEADEPKPNSRTLNKELLKAGAHYDRENETADTTRSQSSGENQSHASQDGNETTTAGRRRRRRRRNKPAIPESALDSAPQKTSNITSEAPTPAPPSAPSTTTTINSDSNPAPAKKRRRRKRRSKRTTSENASSTPTNTE